MGKANGGYDDMRDSVLYVQSRYGFLQGIEGVDLYFREKSGREPPSVRDLVVWAV